MIPTEHQIRLEAHARWVNGGCVDGFALDDWVGAEQDLLLTMNYEVAVHYILDEQPRQYIGSKKNRKCRYCGAEPPATFRSDAHAIPEFIGNKSLIANDECDDCNGFFSKNIEDSLGKMLSPLRTLLAIPGKNGVPTQKSNDKGFRLEYDRGWPGFNIKDTATNPVMRENVAEQTMSADLSTQPFVPVRVLKCLAKMALAIMPDADLARCSRSLKWVRSDDDKRWLDEVREDMTYFSFVPIAFPRPMATLFKRATDTPMPAFIFVVGVASLMLQAYVPLCSEDDRYSGQAMIAPRLGHAGLLPEGPTQWSVIPVKSADVVKDAALQLVMGYECRHEGP